ncbi:uncharacterized protein C8Q71DRAFT_768421 [Rhodofomes roseus]|uniref:Uncharacterized protein n=1 Tax=Rhodofomes roseus TaxID=34475 RepID=A0ABQ8KBW0_9APHY|nr:uncharacterized protein C8Q71DRAFT_768421 [Rhodofomes roseus]KAH9835041.1 hypothetical protein C8Q71DRAFT_768421 [Rhodofomes roseus]
MASEYAWVTSTHSSLTPTSSAALNTIASTSPSYSLSLSVAPFLPDPPENGQHTPLPTVSGFVPLSSVATPTSADATSATITGSRPTEVLAPAATGSRTQAWSIVLIVSCIVFLLIALVAIGLRWLWKRRARNMATASLTPFDYECHADDKPVRFWRQFALSMSSLAKEPPRPQTPDIVCAGNRRSVIDALPHGTMLYDSGTNDAAGTAALRYLVLSNGSRSVDPASYTTLDPRAFAPDAHLSVVSAYGDMAPRRASRDASVRLSLKHANFVEPHPVVLSQMAQPPGNWPYIYHNLPAPPPPHHILSQQGQHPSFPALSPQSVQTFPTHSPSHQTHMPLRLPLILSAHQYSSYHSGLSAQQGSVIGHQNGSDPSVSSRWPITQQEALVAASPGRQPRRRAEDGGVCLAGGTPPRRDRDTGVRGEHQDVAESSYTVSDGGHSDETLPPAYGAY